MKKAATLINDGFLLTDSKLKVCQELVLLLQHLKKVLKFILTMMQGHS